MKFIIYTCGCLTEGSLLTEEVYFVPGIHDALHHLGLLFTQPGMVNGVAYLQRLQYGKKNEVVETGVVIVTAYSNTN